MKIHLTIATFALMAVLAFPVFAAVVDDYPRARFASDTGNVLCSDSLSVVAASGNWIVAECGVYAHYGIHGRGYSRLIAVNAQVRALHRYPGVGMRSASGLQVEPESSGLVASPDGQTVAGMSANRLTLYRLPE